MLTFFIILTPLQELDNPNRPDDTTGMTLIGILFSAYLALTWRRIKNLKE